MRNLLAIFVALSFWACDEGIVRVTRYPDGRIREKWMEKGPPGKPAVRQGPYQSFYPDGRPLMAIPYADGRRDGRARAWDAAGRLSAEREWSRGFLVRELRYDTLGKSIADRRFAVRTAPAKVPGPGGDSLDALETCSWTVAEDKNGAVPGGERSVRNGVCEMRYAGGALLAERHFRDGKLDGPAKAWYGNGALWIEGAYRGDRPEGRWKAYAREGRPLWSADYRDGLRDGLWEEWFPEGGRKSETRYQRGRPEGGYQEWYPNGRLRLRGSFSAGRRQGPEEAWYPDGGRLYEAHYAGGLLEGDFSQWHPGGKLRLRCRFARGRKDGLSRVWYPSGGLQEQAYYKGGRLEGPYRTWSPDGLPMAMKEYRGGKVAFDSKAKELLELLGADQLRVPAGLMGFYWGMGAKECRANLGLYQAARVRADSGGMSADIVAFPDRRPTLAHIRLAFNAQGELWGIKLDLRQESAADFFPLCENLEVEMGTTLGTTRLRRSEGAYAMTRKRDWGRFTVETAASGVREELPVLSAEGFGPGGKGWLRFALENNLYREYVDPASASISPPRWDGEALLAGR